MPGGPVKSWGVLSCPDARVLHHGKASSRQNGLIPLHALRSHNLFFRKWAGRRAAALHRALWLFAVSGRYCVAHMANSVKRSESWTRRQRLYRMMIRWATGREGL